MTLEEAAIAAGRYGELQAAIGAIDAKRQARAAKVNAIADAKIAPLIDERDGIAQRLEAWFKAAPAELLQGKKSIPLAGGTIGMRIGNVTLVMPQDIAAAIKSLLRRKWATSLVRTKHEPDKVALKKALDGPNKAALKKLGFGSTTLETFFIDVSVASIGAGDRATRMAA